MNSAEFDAAAAVSPGPSSARIYDFLLGGSHHFQVDRDAAAEFVRAWPGASAAMRVNRDFLGRAVRYLAAECGVKQFLDLGSGIPTMGNVHEVARRANPDARVVYVDRDDVAVLHSRAILGGDHGTWGVVDHGRGSGKTVFAALSVVSTTEPQR